MGKFRTAPPTDSKEPIRIGFFSCQNWNAGFYNAQAGLAKEKDLDLVLCLGDYIYEKGTYTGGPRPTPPASTATATCRRSTSTARSTASTRATRTLQDMHAAHPFVMVWDDHEVEDNYAGDEDLDNGGDDPAGPVRGAAQERLQGLLRGDAADEGEGRPDPHLRLGQARRRRRAVLHRPAPVPRHAAVRRRDPRRPCPDAENPARTMLGATQKAWFKSAVSKSKANWKLWGSETDGDERRPAARARRCSSTPGTAIRASARRSSSTSSPTGSRTSPSLTGDIHTFFAGDMTTTGRQGGTPAGVELVGGSATSLGLPEFLGVPSSALYPLAAAERPAHQVRRLRPPRLRRGHGDEEGPDLRVQGGRRAHPGRHAHPAEVVPGRRRRPGAPGRLAQSASAPRARRRSSRRRARSPAGGRSRRCGWSTGGRRSRGRRARPPRRRSPRAVSSGCSMPRSPAKPQQVAATGTMTSSASSPAIAASVAVELEVAARAGRVDRHRAELAARPAARGSSRSRAQAIESRSSSRAWRSAFTSLSSGDRLDREPERAGARVADDRQLAAVAPAPERVDRVVGHPPGARARSPSTSTGVAQQCPATSGGIQSGSPARAETATSASGRLGARRPAPFAPGRRSG